MTKLVHNTRDARFRTPFGAVKCGDEIFLAIEADGNAFEAVLRVWIGGEGETLHPMAKERTESGNRFFVSFVREKPGLLWYTFRVRETDESGNERVIWIGPEEGKRGGNGCVYDREPASFQITVYRERKLPDWYRNAVFYQIFPDRFAPGDASLARANEAAFSALHPNGIPRRIVRDWNKIPEYRRDETGAITEWEFYGGTLDGIREKLPYLAELGITALYLNPIFEAASNHRYDTGDYLQVDPLLGGDPALDRLIRAAREHGISIMLDGVFNHTGWDSLYFNRFGNYPTKGAYGNEDSPYRSWFTFGDYPNGYDSWWGVADLPAVNENDPSYRDFIYGAEDSVVRRYLKKGVRAWRLDVADELPDSFIEGLKTAALEEDPDAVVIGEVWEDASNKVSYGELRRYLLGSELDGAMHYPVRTAVHDWLLGRSDAFLLFETFVTLMENYPPTAFYGAFTLMGSHDRARMMTVMGDAPDPDSLSEEERRAYRLSPEQRAIAERRVRLMTLLQMTLPGVPSVYYGDEAGMEGMSDPFNRGTFPWGAEDSAMTSFFRDAIRLRKSDPVFTDGAFGPFAVNADVFGFFRVPCERIRKGETCEKTGGPECPKWNGTVLVLANRSRTETYTFPLADCAGDLTGRAAALLFGTAALSADGTVSIPPLGTAVIRIGA